MAVNLGDGVPLGAFHVQEGAFGAEDAQELAERVAGELAWRQDVGGRDPALQQRLELTPVTQAFGTTAP